MKILLASLLLIVNVTCFSQDVTNIESLSPEEEYENISVKKLYSDSKASYLIIWIKQGVRSHKHVTHTESIVVMEGTGEMTVDGKTFLIKAGDYFVIPENTFHALKVTSQKPMKVISVQAPEFFGEDRVYEEVK
jgi:mannose-6-phosphate isomerase-like protein (cupin superfamily)